MRKKTKIISIQKDRSYKSFNNNANKSIDHNIEDRTFDKKNISSSIPRQRNHFVKKENESTNLVCYNLIKGKNDI